MQTDFTYRYHLPNSASGMPDRGRYLDTPYIPSSTEINLIHLINNLFKKLFGNQEDEQQHQASLLDRN